jgi:hypothetical protein
MIIPQFERIRAVANTPKSEVIHVEMMPDALCCWVFHLPPTLDYA